MLIGRKSTIRNYRAPLELKIGNTPLEQVQEFCYLGFIIDDLFSFNASIDMMHRKAASRFRTLVHLRELMTVNCAMIFMKSMILPFFDYGCLFLSSCTSKSLAKLLQNRILRCVLRAPRSRSIRELHKTCQILTIKDRILYNQIKFIYVNLISDTPVFSYHIHSGLPTRSINTRELSLSKPNYTLYRKSIFYDGVKVWNSLDPSLKEDMSLPTFKYKLKNYFLDTY